MTLKSMALKPRLSTNAMASASVTSGHGEYRSSSASWWMIQSYPAVAAHSLAVPQQAGPVVVRGRRVGEALDRHALVPSRYVADQLVGAVRRPVVHDVDVHSLTGQVSQHLGEDVDLVVDVHDRRHPNRWAALDGDVPAGEHQGRRLGAIVIGVDRVAPEHRLGDALVPQEGDHLVERPLAHGGRVGRRWDVTGAPQACPIARRQQDVGHPSGDFCEPADEGPRIDQVLDDTGADDQRAIVELADGARQALLEVGLDALRGGQPLVESGEVPLPVDDGELPAVAEGHQRVPSPAADADDLLDARSLREVERHLVDVRLTGDADRIVGHAGPHRT